MDFKEQITDLQLVVDTTPRTYIRWKNTEEGRDKTDCYERLIVGSYVVYINTFNRNNSIVKGHKFFDTLESIYQKALKESSKTNSRKAFENVIRKILLQNSVDDSECIRIKFENVDNVANFICDEIDFSDETN